MEHINNLWENEPTIVGAPGPQKKEIEVLNRLIFNEIGHLTDQERVQEAIALLYAFINLSEHSGLSIPKLLTDKEYPTYLDYGPKYQLFENGFLSLGSTYYPAVHDCSKLISNVLSGVIKDPLYGEWSFFNYLEDDYPEYRRARWGFSEEDGVKTGIIYGKFEYNPISFLKARAEGIARIEHLEHWEKQKMYMV